jgi:hypothetical protein
MLIALWLGVGLGCQHLGFGSDACSGAGARDRLPGEFSLHVRARIMDGGEAQRHEAWVQVSKRRVTLVGLTPLGTQAYTLVLDGESSDLDNRIGRHLGLDPRLLLDAVARAWIAPRGRVGETALPRSGERLLPGDAPGEWRYAEESSALRARVVPEAGGVRVTSPACGYDAQLVLLPAS